MSIKIEVDDKQSAPIFQQIIDGIERLILTGEIQEEAFLPSVRELAIILSVNPNTVSKAYQILQAQDLVEVVRGLGLRVKKLNSKTADHRRSAILGGKVSELVTLSNSLKISMDDLIALIRQISKGVKK